jgi:hypothetical protein
MMAEPIIVAANNNTNNTAATIIEHSHADYFDHVVGLSESPAVRSAHPGISGCTTVRSFLWLGDAQCNKHWFCLVLSIKAHENAFGVGCWWTVVASNRTGGGGRMRWVVARRKRRTRSMFGDANGAGFPLRGGTWCSNLASRDLSVVCSTP